MCLWCVLWIRRICCLAALLWILTLKSSPPLCLRFTLSMYGNVGGQRHWCPVLIHGSVSEGMKFLSKQKCSTLFWNSIWGSYSSGSASLDISTPIALDGSSASNFGISVIKLPKILKGWGGNKQRQSQENTDFDIKLVKNMHPNKWTFWKQTEQKPNSLKTK